MTDKTSMTTLASGVRSLGRPNSFVSELDFWDDRFEGRRLFSELLGTFFLVLVAVGGGMVGASATPCPTGPKWSPRG